MEESILIFPSMSFSSHVLQFFFRKQGHHRYMPQGLILGEKKPKQTKCQVVCLSDKVNPRYLIQLSENMKLATVAFKSRQKSRTRHSLSSKKRSSHFLNEHACNLYLLPVKMDVRKRCEPFRKLCLLFQIPKGIHRSFPVYLNP